MTIKKITNISLSVNIFFAALIALCPINAIHAADDKNKEEKKVEQKDSIDEANASKTGNEAELYKFERPTIEEESYTWLIFKTIFVLGTLVGGFYYFFKFVTKKTGIQILGRDLTKTLAIVPIGQNKSLQVIDLAGRLLVIGVTDSSINLISEIKDREEIDRIRLQSSKSTPIETGGFQEYISKYITKFINKKRERCRENIESNHEIANEDVEYKGLDFLEKQRKRLKNLNGNNNEK